MKSMSPRPEIRIKIQPGLQGMEAMGLETAGTAGDPHKLRVGVGAFLLVGTFFADTHIDQLSQGQAEGGS